MLLNLLVKVVWLIEVGLRLVEVRVWLNEILGRGKLLHPLLIDFAGIDV